ncbi:cytochrome O ubiquinol oxidase [Martelella endophytica]|uniref:Ubiquinol oxidase polypeptide II n=2 Tax=Martelella endophytica TaxID=1486262 RepID=A0A0D5LW31_MAREN|nr:cytochrome O ubiquinol oxidase [Martelella endophytica]
MLSGCQLILLDPAGWVANQERDLLVISTLLMLIIIVPVLVMAVYIPWRYRDSRKATDDYDPEFEHSSLFEAFIWGVPVMIVIALGAVTAIYTHKLDPYKPLDHIAAEPLEIDVVSMDWKWLFIYPEQNIAVVNELVLPTDRPVNLRLTSSSVMNTFSVPALAGMIYTMAGMETKLHLVADDAGKYYGRSANYSGPGYAHMDFETYAVSEDEFTKWVDNAKSSGTELSVDAYQTLDKPSAADGVYYYNGVAENLFDKVVGLCVEPGKVCIGDMMMQDMMGGGGLKGIETKKNYVYDEFAPGEGFDQHEFEGEIHANPDEPRKGPVNVKNPDQTVMNLDGGVSTASETARQ